jgi:endonuclease/exonuclease/phosphatase family metal-dependent hydrolase
MAERMSTAVRMDRARANGKLVRVVNGHLKRKERASREKKIAMLVQKGTFPYTPAVMSYLAAKLGKKVSEITEADAKAAVQ